VAIVQQNKIFMMIWKHIPRATNNTMEPRAVLETLNYLPENMTVLVSSDSQYVRTGTKEWIHKWKRNGWKNAKKERVTDSTLWQKLDTAIALHAHVEFTLVKGHSGILLNECPDQLVTRGVPGDSYSTDPSHSSPTEGT
jgi:ribonuclease HI